MERSGATVASSVRFQSTAEQANRHSFYLLALGQLKSNAITLVTMRIRMSEECDRCIKQEENGARNARSEGRSADTKTEATLRASDISFSSTPRVD